MTDRTHVFDPLYFISIVSLIVFSTLVLISISPQIFPGYYIIIAFSFILFFISLKTDFEIFVAFSKITFIVSIFLLVLPLVLGQVTRGTVRWIPIFGLSLQPSEIVRPFLLLYASFLFNPTSKEITTLLMIKYLLLISLPVFLILIQPSLGVSILTAFGFLGVIVTSKLEKKKLLPFIIAVIALAPFLWNFLAPYQKGRIVSFLNPTSDPMGSGYNSIQAMISVGSGRIWGRGIGEGVQTQLSFLPEKQTDFIFASISEELGFIGSVMIIILLFLLFWKLTNYFEKAGSPVAKGYVAGVFLVLLVETFIHIGMNMGVLPITGVPLPLVSAGGSSLLGTMVSLGIAHSASRINK